MSNSNPVFVLLNQSDKLQKAMFPQGSLSVEARGGLRINARSVTAAEEKILQHIPHVTFQVKQGAGYDLHDLIRQQAQATPVIKAEEVAPQPPKQEAPVVEPKQEGEVVEPEAGETTPVEGKAPVAEVVEPKAEEVTEAKPEEVAEAKPEEVVEPKAEEVTEAKPEEVAEGEKPATDVAEAGESTEGQPARRRGK